MDDMERVRALGGLHVIGSERHEARRIDNQLRGRSARQGDPGSSRFYLSMEDELMRLFGGQQADGLMQRMKIDDAMPLEVGLVSRIVEQSQTRVEGANFDVRKHLLEYDDVLNTQRAKIYAQRNRIFTKDDLSEDVSEMLNTEVTRRLPEALQDPEGPWKLLAWLEQIQPPLVIGSYVLPSFTLRLLVDHILGPAKTMESQQVIQALLQIAADSLQAEEEHLLKAVNTLLDQSQDRLESQIAERLDAVDTFFEGLSLEDETDTRSPRQLADELASVARIQLRLAPELQRTLRADPESIAEQVRSAIRTALSSQAMERLVMSVERRLEEALEIPSNQALQADWDEVADQLLAAVQDVYARRRERYLGEQGQVRRDLENAIGRGGEIGENGIVQLLLLMPQGSRAAFDKKTHRRIVQRTNRLTYTHFAARFLENRDPQEITTLVLEHLNRAQDVVHLAWGNSEWARLANSSPAELNATTQANLQRELGDERFQLALDQPLSNLNPAEREIVVRELGRQSLTEIYRQLLLSVITELWVDYLTQMEALRVSIGLEAYAQRDPLVQYKNRAFGLFQDLLNNMRLGVVTRMFTFRPRDLGAVQASASRTETAAAEEADLPTNGDGDDTIDEAEPEVETESVVKSGNGQTPSQSEQQLSKSKKRRRRRH